MKEIDILLVEDNTADADLTIRALRKRNINLQITHIQDGAEAIDYILAQGRFSKKDGISFPKLILLDLQLPKINGQEVLRKIKQNPVTKMIPTVILTSSNHQVDVLKCYESGANGYMVKPMDFEEYLHQVSKAVDFWIDINYLPHY